ncbi:MAG TPA: hypothetical protein VIA81_03745 [Acidimicrobiia bacterium]|jgi:hypothetical protein
MPGPFEWWVAALVIVAAAVLITPSNQLVRWILKRARGVALPEAAGAGRWIGGMERLLIFILVIIGEPGAASLVAAAKSLLRFPEITGDHSRISPEYVLVGSLASWLLAFAVGAAVRTVLVSTGSP